MATINTTTAAADHPVTWADLKYWLRLDDESEKTYLLALAGDALDYAEEYTESTLLARSVVTEHTERAGSYDLPRGPVNSITAVVDGDGEQVHDYRVIKTGTWQRLLINADYAMPLTITYNAGFSVLPRLVKRAILLHCEMLYRNRGGEGDMAGINRCYDPYRRNVWLG
jgi:uncharacterized phiE125 gp8 family phage protein